MGYNSFFCANQERSLSNQEKPEQRMPPVCVDQMAFIVRHSGGVLGESVTTGHSPAHKPLMRHTCTDDRKEPPH